MQHLSKQEMVKGLPTIEFSDGVFNGCALGKHPQDKFEKGHAWRASSPLELVRSDLMGLVPILSMRKKRYVLTFIDDYSRFTWVYFLKLKSKVFQHLNIFKVHTKDRKSVV